MNLYNTTRKNSLTPGFTEINESDTPYYKYLQEKKSMDKAPVIYEQISNSDERATSKNSIFEMDHRILKPVTKMNSEELAALKFDIRNKMIPTPTDPKMCNEKISVPLYHPINDKRTYPPDRITNDYTAYLMMDTSSGSQNGVLIDLDCFDSTKLHVNYLPTSKNFLGEGLYSKVYRGQFQIVGSEIERPCAIKKMKDFAEAQNSALMECLILSHLKHGSIVGFIVAEDENGVSLKDVVKKHFETISSSFVHMSINVVLEFCSNGNIWNWIQNNPLKVGKKLWKKWLLELIGGIEAIHSMGIVHHDLKPHNILLTSLMDIRICDFGNALIVPEAKKLFLNDNTSYDIVPGKEVFPDSQMLTDGTGRGTPAYTAPELFIPQQKYSFYIDIYSFGVVLYTILSNTIPFANCKSNVQIIMAARQGFFNNENQRLVSSWINPDPSEGKWQFPNGEFVPMEYVDLVLELLHLDHRKRPTILQIHERFREASFSQ